MESISNCRDSVENHSTLGDIPDVEYMPATTVAKSDYDAGCRADRVSRSVQYPVPDVP